MSTSINVKFYNKPLQKGTIYNIVHYNTNALICVEGGILLLNPNSPMPIYIQIADWLENEILNDHLKVDGKVYSQYQLADMFNINPATAAKGLNILAMEQILYKKRGLGMFVAKEGKEIILEKRKNQTLKRLIKEVVMEATRLKVEKTELVDLINREFDENGEGKE